MAPSSMYPWAPRRTWTRRAWTRRSRGGPRSWTLWTVVNERDELGDDLVPDYLTSVRDGAFYGWPFSYFGQNEDPRKKGERPDLVAKAVVPDLAIGAHTAALGLTFYDASARGEVRSVRTPRRASRTAGRLAARSGRRRKRRLAGYLCWIRHDGATLTAE